MRDVMVNLTDVQTWVVVIGGILAAWDLLRSRSLRRLELLANVLSGPLKDFEGLADVNRALFLRYYRAAFFLDTRWFPLFGGILFSAIGGLSIGLTALVWRSLAPWFLVVMVLVSLLYVERRHISPLLQPRWIQRHAQLDARYPSDSLAGHLRTRSAILPGNP